MSDRDTTERERNLERRAKQVFDDSVARIDAAARSRLTQARHRALQELEPARSRLRWWLAPAGALAAAALAAVVMVYGGGPAPDAGLQATALDDLEILLGDEDLEMLDEEIEFYAWLEEQPEFTAPAATGDGVG
jgi:hypothetical protein